MRQRPLSRAIASLIRCGCPGVLGQVENRQDHASGYGVGYQTINQGTQPSPPTTYEMDTGFLEAGAFNLGGPSGIQESTLWQNTRTLDLYNNIYTDLLPLYQDVADGTFPAAFEYSTQPPPMGEDVTLWNKTRYNCLLGTTPGLAHGKGKFYQQCKLGLPLLDYDATHLLGNGFAASWTGSWIYTDPDNEYWRVDVLAQNSIRFTRLDVDPYLYAWYEEETVPDLKLLLEGYVLAYATPSAETYTVTPNIPSEVLGTTSWGYSWHSNWSGTSAVMVTHEVTGSNWATTPDYVDMQMSVTSRVLILTVTHIKTIPTSTFTMDVTVEETHDWLFQNTKDFIWYPAISQDVAYYCPIEATLILEPLETTQTADDVPIYAYYGASTTHENNELCIVRHSRAEDDPGRTITDPCPTITQGDWIFCGGEYHTNNRKDERGQRITHTVKVNDGIAASVTARDGEVNIRDTASFSVQETGRINSPITVSTGIDRIECNYVNGLCVTEITDSLVCYGYPGNNLNADRYFQQGVVSYSRIRGDFRYNNSGAAFVIPHDCAEGVIVASNSGLDTPTNQSSVYTELTTIEGTLYSVIGQIRCDLNPIADWSDNKVPAGGITTNIDYTDSGQYYYYRGTMQYYGRYPGDPKEKTDSYVANGVTPTKVDVPALAFLQVEPLDPCESTDIQIIQGIGEEMAYVYKGAYEAENGFPVALETALRSIVIGAV